MTNHSTRTGSVAGPFRAAIVAAFLSLAPASMADEVADVRDLVEERNNFIISELQAAKSADALTKNSALHMIRTHISPMFDFGAIARGAMGKHWRKASETERGKISELFKTLLEKTYANTLAKFDNQKVAVKDVVVRDNGMATVNLIVSRQANKVELSYTLEKIDGEWRVVDVLVEGISLLASYRKQFSQIIRTDGISGLIARLTKIAAV